MTVARKLTTNVAYAIGSRLVGAAFGLTTTAIMARHLGPEAFGLFRTAFAWSALICVAADLGLSIVCLQEISRSHADRQRIVGTALGLRLLIGAGCVLASVVAASFLPSTADDGAGLLATATAIAAIGSVCTLGNEVVTTVFQQSLTQKRASLSELLGGAAALLFTGIAAICEGGVLAFAAAAAGGLAVTLLTAVLLAERILPVRPRLDWALSRQMVRSGLPLFAGDVIGMVTLRLDTVLLSVLSVATQVGYYGVANKIRDIAVKLPYLFAALLMPILTRSAADPPLFRRILADALVAAWIFAVGLMLVLGCFADVIVSLLAGGKYLAAVDIVRWTGPALAAGCMAAVLQYAAFALDRSVAVLGAAALSSTLALVAMFSLIPARGAEGAAIAVAAGEVAFMLGLIRTASPDGRGIAPWARLLAVALIGAICAAAILALRSGGLHWLLAALTGGLSFPALLLATRTVTVAQLRSLTAKS